MKNWRLILGSILLLAFLLRVLGLNISPPALSWDETAIGYDAWAIAQTGQDQWGRQWPVAFLSFGENKYPLHIYLSAIGVKLFGLSDWSVKLPLAVLGVVNIGLVYYLAYLMTKRREVGLVAAFLLAISPWHLQFSRLVWETNVSLFCFLVGVIAFWWSLSKSVWWRVVAFGFWGGCLYTYNAPKIFILLWIGLIGLVFWKEFWSRKLVSFVCGLVMVGALLVGVIHPSLGGGNRFDQVRVPDAVVEQTMMYQLTQQKMLGYGEVVIRQYFGYFSPQFLFISGDANLRHSIQMVGQVYWFDLILLPLGLWWCWRQKKPTYLLLIGWFLLAPVPGIFFKESPHASRAMFALGGWQMISALGFVYLFQLLIKKIDRKLIFAGFGLVVMTSLIVYLYNYYLVYPKVASADFQYAYHQIYNQYQTRFGNYDQIVVTDFYSQPYIFSLYHQPVTPSELNKTVRYSLPGDSGRSVITEYDKYRFVPINDSLKISGKTLVFAAPTETVPAGLVPIDQIRNLDGSVALIVYETTN